MTQQNEAREKLSRYLEMLADSWDAYILDKSKEVIGFDEALEQIFKIFNDAGFRLVDPKSLTVLADKELDTINVYPFIAGKSFKARDYAKKIAQTQYDHMLRELEVEK